MKRVDYTVDFDSLRERMDRLKNLHGVPNPPPVRILKRNQDGDDKNPNPANVSDTEFVQKSAATDSPKLNTTDNEGAQNPKTDSGVSMGAANEGVQNPKTDSGVSMGAATDGKTAGNGGKTAPISYASAIKTNAPPKKANFRFVDVNSEVNGVDVLLPLASVLEVNNRFCNSLYGYFLGDRLAFPVVETYVKNSWAKFGLKKVMMNSSGFFFFKFESKEGMLQVLEKGPWMIRSTPIFLSEWTPNVSLAKQDRTSVPVWVKLYDVPLVAYTEDGLSMLASKLGKPILLDSYTSHVCLQSWGRHSYARAFIGNHPLVLTVRYLAMMIRDVLRKLR